MLKIPSEAELSVANAFFVIYTNSYLVSISTFWSPLLHGIKTMLG